VTAPSSPPTAAWSLRSLGLLGAILATVGLVLAGSGYLMSGLGEQSEFNCTTLSGGTACSQSQLDSDLNTTFLGETFTGIGYVVGGVGGGIAFATMVAILARRGAPRTMPGPGTRAPAPVPAPTFAPPYVPPPPPVGSLETDPADTFSYPPPPPPRR
jgi:hypothetical protein